MTAALRWADGLAELVEYYDLFLLDQYGVLHNGREAYPGVADALRRLAALGKHVIALTNSGRSAAYNTQRIQRFGIPVEHVQCVVTSGDVARDWLREHCPGARCIALTSGGNRHDAEAAGLVIVDDPIEAEIVLVSGLPDGHAQLSEAAYAPLLDAAAARDLPLVCANPDVHGVAGREVVLCAGSIATWYEQRGGEVRYFGKPYPEAFEYAMRLASGIPAERTIMVGDLPETDLAGAQAAGIASALVLGGVHAADTPGPDNAQRAEQAAALVRAAGTRADWCLPQLRWTG